jgi:hypothetical protein
VREFAPDVSRGVSCQIARLCTRAPAEPGPGGIFDRAMRARCSKQHVTVRACTRCRLAVLPRDQLDGKALPGVAGQQTSRLRAHNTSPAGGDPWVLANPLPGPRWPRLVCAWSALPGAEQGAISAELELH